MTTDTITNAANALLADSDLSLSALQQKLSAALSGLDWADLYLQQRMIESWHLEDGIVKTGQYSSDGGIGLRAVRGETTAFASSDVINRGALDYLGEVAHVAKTHGGAQKNTTLSANADHRLRFGDNNPLTPTTDRDKIALLKKVDAHLRGEDGVESIMASLAASYETVLLIRPDEKNAADERPLVRISIQVVATDGKRRETGYAGGGARRGYDFFTDALVADLCRQALADARAKLEAQDSPAGKMPVVLGPGWAGILLHEAVGHGLEGDFNRKRLSAFSGRIGEKVAADGVTVIDAGNIAERRGSLSVDDEGTPVQETVLIENGVLRGYMQDLTNARLMGVAATGNGRRESYAHAPMPRMTNTFMPAGNYDPQDIIASVKNGVYAEDFNGGEVDITNGNFVFVASKARLIENGRLGAVVKGATIIGNGPAIMPLVSMVGNDFSLDPGVGTCGKDGQWVPVGVGQPTMKIDALTVGGTQT